MTREDIKTIIDIVHKTIYGFFDVCDEEETPMTDKDKLLLKINKAICTNIKALEQEPCGDLISRQAVIDALTKTSGIRGDALKALYDLPSVNPQEPKTGHWIEHNAKSYECSECHNTKSLYAGYKTDYCPDCGAKMGGTENDT